MATRQYIGARYVPKLADPIAWDKANSYEALTIVTYLNNSYTSKKAVPANTEITDTKYWVVTGNYNAQVEQYRQDTLSYKEEVDGLKIFKTVEEFGARGDGVTDDTNAIVNALKYGKDNNVTISTKSGTYKISSSITITSTRFNLNGGSIVSNNNSITLDTKSLLCNGKITSTNVILANGDNILSHINIYDITGTAITTEKSEYGCIVSYVHISNENDSKCTIGIDVKGSDCWFEYISGLNPKTAIINRGGNNYFSYVHSWLNTNADFSGSRFIDNYGTGVVFANCCCDSYETFMYQETDYLMAHFSSCLWIYNANIIALRNKALYGIVGGNEKYLSGNILFNLNTVNTRNCTLTLGNLGDISISVVNGTTVEDNGYDFATFKSKCSISTITTNDLFLIRKEGKRLLIKCPLWLTGGITTFTVDMSSIRGISNNQFYTRIPVKLNDNTYGTATVVLEDNTLTVTVDGSTPMSEMFLNIYC